MKQDRNLAKGIMETISLRYDDDYVDPWRLYQETSLCEDVCAFCGNVLGNDQIDIIASVSDLGLPLAIYIAFQLHSEGRFSGPVVLLTLENNKLISRPFVSLSDKNILVCDDILAGGGHMEDRTRRLTLAAANVVKVIVLLDNHHYPQRKKAKIVYSRFKDNYLALTDSTYHKVGR